MTRASYKDKRGAGSLKSNQLFTDFLLLRNGLVKPLWQRNLVGPLLVINKCVLDGGEIFFLVIERFALVKSLLLMSTLR